MGCAMCVYIHTLQTTIKNHKYRHGYESTDLQPNVVNRCAVEIQCCFLEASPSGTGWENRRRRGDSALLVLRLCYPAVRPVSGGVLCARLCLRAMAARSGLDNEA